MQYKQSDCPGQRTHPDITSTRHGAAIQAVRRLQRKFRMRSRERHEPHQRPHTPKDHVAIAKCHPRTPNQPARKGKIERTAPVMLWLPCDGVWSTARKMN